MSLVLFFTCLLSLLLTFCWYRHSLRRQWFDVPNARSSHSRPTPTSGGVGFLLVCLGGLVALRVAGMLESREFLVLLLGGVIATLGLADDSLDLSVRVRVLVQLAVVALMLLLAPGLPPLFLGSWQLPWPWLLAPLLLLYGVWQINFYNFMDGIDGLAASQGLFVSLALAWFTADAGEFGLATAALGLACALAGFLPFNAPSARLFMGDVGSNFLGYALLALGLLACQRGVLDYWSYLILMGAFLMDTTTTLVGRMRAGHVWYHGHRTHAYQLAARHLGSHARIVVVYAGINLAWLLPLAVLNRHLAPQFGLWMALIAWTPLAIATWWIRRRLLGGAVEVSR